MEPNILGLCNGEARPPAYGFAFAPLSASGHRPHPVFCYDREKRLFTLEYEQDRAYSAPTVIYLPRPFQSVEADGSYHVEARLDGKAAELLLETGIGPHRVTIQF